MRLSFWNQESSNSANIIWRVLKSISTSFISDCLMRKKSFSYRSKTCFLSFFFFSLYLAVWWIGIHIWKMRIRRQQKIGKGGKERRETLKMSFIWKWIWLTGCCPASYFYFLFFFFLWDGKWSHDCSWCPRTGRWVKCAWVPVHTVWSRDPNVNGKW